MSVYLRPPGHVARLVAGNEDVRHGEEDEVVRAGVGTVAQAAQGCGRQMAPGQTLLHRI